ncbi:hypothetical protein GCM10008098_13960 [Rhodanobacter panaciterrae]|uniref:Uncharacterized protein n=1 Tax=Rhodanobacter panaciterrae TaxID=490572 RepID=A0ABQ2ZSV9_9GAMM|nr:hypothetical protein [Rhodanobacter panaciterrae]GGY22128.1 hypothetical protein GCM10008098_13960 [Rhodanobacter panaciterrae]
MHRRISKEQWLAYGFLLLLVLAALAGVLAPDRDIYHGARQLSGTVESSEAIQASGLSGGTYARLHVRLDDGSETIACTPWGGPLEKGVKVALRKGACAMDPDGNLAARTSPGSGH